MRFFILLALLTFVLVIVPHSSARTTPEDIVQSQRQTFNQRVSKYSETNKQKLEQYSKKIADLNKKQTDALTVNMERQSEILDEYIDRNNIEERQADGITRNLQDPIENARYWITYAHEAVAYQAAEIYIFNLSSESNIKGDLNAKINELNADMNILKGKVEKSRKIVEDLVSKS
jgi:hypothetical protein